MTSGLKLCILVNWKEEGRWFVLNILKKMVQSVDVLQPVSLKNTVNDFFTYVSNYLSEFYIPVTAFFYRNRYDVIISWQMRIGICYGILNRIFHSRKHPVHIIQDFHIDLTETRWLYRMQIALLKMAIPGIDYFCCTSTEEERIYSKLFKIPRERIIFLPLAESSASFDNPVYSIQDYIFSYGKSDRDFDTLIQSVANLNIKTYILSSKYVPKCPFPENIRILRNYVSDQEMIKWIGSSRIVVIPLKDYRIAAGQISMLETMAIGRPLIITDNMATREYATNDKTALFYTAGNAAELSELIQYLWNNPELAEDIGKQARKSMLKSQDSFTTVLGNLLERCAPDIYKGEKT